MDYKVFFLQSNEKIANGLTIEIHTGISVLLQPGMCLVGNSQKSPELIAAGSVAERHFTIRTIGNESLVTSLGGYH